MLTLLIFKIMLILDIFLEKFKRVLKCIIFILHKKLLVSIIEEFTKIVVKNNKKTINNYINNKRFYDMIIKQVMC